METTKLVYIMDPLCGWCYGNVNSTVQVFEAYKDRIPVEIIPGGMWAGENVRRQSKQMAAYFKKHDLQIADRTGSTFSDAYFKLIEDEHILLDSEIPSRAIVTLQQLWPEKSVAFMVAVQKARYFYGKDLNIDRTYEDICASLDIQPDLFIAHFHSAEMTAATRLAFARAAGYATSYPTLLLETNTGMVLIEQGYATPETMMARIAREIAIKS